MIKTRIKKVLVVEDDEHWQEIYRTLLSPMGVEAFPALTLEDARELLATQTDFSAVVMDGQIGKAGVEKTSALVREIRIRGFKGPVIAASASVAYCIALLGAGCDYEIGGNKEYTVPLLKNLLETVS